MIRERVSFRCVLLAFALIASSGCDRQTKMRSPDARDCLHDRNECLDPTWRVLSENEHNSVAKSFERINRAYTNGQLEVMRTQMFQMPGAVTNAINWHYTELARVFSKSVDEEFLGLKRLYDFGSVEDCNRFMSVNLLAVRFLGEVHLRRRDYSGALVRADRNALRQLQRYKEKFHREGLLEFESCIDKFIAEWTARIDAADGFTRMYMRHQIGVQYFLVTQKGWSQERLLDAIRHNADGLIKAGYKPKWLDEEFPATTACQKETGRDGQ